MVYSHKAAPLPIVLRLIISADIVPAQSCNSVSSQSTCGLRAAASLHLALHAAAAAELFPLDLLVFFLKRAPLKALTLPVLSAPPALGFQTHVTSSHSADNP